MKLYRISNWSKIFENNRSRAIEKLSWVAVPNHHDGEHFSAIMQHPDGAMIYAAWMLIVQVTSRCHPRGVLVRPDGTPLTPESLSLKTRAPAIWFVKSLKFLEEQTDWIDVEEVADERQVGVTSASSERQDSAPRVRARNGKEGIEQEGIEGKGGDGASLVGEVLPESLSTLEFKAVWKLWIEDRKTRKKPVTTNAAKMQLKQLEAMGEPKAIKCIEQSIANGWQGLFEVKNQNENLSRNTAVANQRPVQPVKGSSPVGGF